MVQCILCLFSIVSHNNSTYIKKVTFREVFKITLLGTWKIETTLKWCKSSTLSTYSRPSFFTCYEEVFGDIAWIEGITFQP